MPLIFANYEQQVTPKLLSRCRAQKMVDMVQPVLLRFQRSRAWVILWRSTDPWNRIDRQDGAPCGGGLEDVDQDRRFQKTETTREISKDDLEDVEQDGDPP